MDLEDDFFLGEAETSDFFLGNPDDDVFLGNESKTPKTLNSEKGTSSEKKDFSELFSSYNLLKIAEKPARVDFEEFFKNNPEIFKFAGTDYFKSLSENEFKTFEKKCDYLISLAHEKWIDIENQHKLEDFTEAQDVLRSIFRNSEKTKYYSEEIKRSLVIRLKTVLKQKIKDNILDVSEIQELMEIAISIHLVPDNGAGRNAIINWIKKTKETSNFKIESFEETFVRFVSKKEKIERIDSPVTKNNLFREYEKLSKINDGISGAINNKSVEEMKEKMSELLKDNNLLFSNLDLFQTDFLQPEMERQKGHYDFAYPLNTEYFYYLKGTATNIYQFSEAQWRELTMVMNITPEDSATVAFIMGHNKESTLHGIAKLIEENPEMAADRILAGDLETYFSHIGRKNISEEIKKLKLAYKSNRLELVTGVVTLLKQEIDNSATSVQKTADEEKSFDRLLQKSNSLKDFVSFVLKNKSDESLVTRITSDFPIVERLQTLFLSEKKKTSYIKFLLNLMNELLLEADISQYKYAFVKVAKKAEEELVKFSDSISFINIFSELVSMAEQKGIISPSDALPNFIENKEMMFEMYETYFNTSKESKNKKKTKFSTWFHKGEK